MVNTVDINKAFFTQQFKKTRKARELYHAFGTQSVQDSKAIVRMNTCNPIANKDIKIAMQIFGPNIQSL